MIHGTEYPLVKVKVLFSREVPHLLGQGSGGDSPAGDMGIEWGSHR